MKKTGRPLVLTIKGKAEAVAGPPLRFLQRWGLLQRVPGFLRCLGTSGRNLVQRGYFGAYLLQNRLRQRGVALR
jgi:hypothetical protein